MTKCRQRVQQATFERRGWKGDPLYDIRKLLLVGAERLDDQGWQRLREALRWGDPMDEVSDTCWFPRRTTWNGSTFRQSSAPTSMAEQ